MPPPKHVMRLAKVGPKYAAQHGLSSNHHARVWCACMDDPAHPAGSWSERTQAQVLADPRRLGAYDDLGVIDLRVGGSALALYRAHVNADG